MGLCEGWGGKKKVQCTIAATLNESRSWPVFAWGRRWGLSSGCSVHRLRWKASLSSHRSLFTTIFFQSQLSSKRPLLTLSPFFTLFHLTLPALSPTHLHSTLPLSTYYTLSLSSPLCPPPHPHTPLCCSYSLGSLAVFPHNNFRLTKEIFLKKNTTSLVS